MEKRVAVAISSHTKLGKDIPEENSVPAHCCQRTDVNDHFK